MEVVMFTDDTYQSLSDNTINMSSSDIKKWRALKGKLKIANSISGYSVYKFDEKSYFKCLIR